ncbi:DUF2637 domain-containing protein [Kitasatospora sp. NPDC028055]|uniref:DUF2637 domain-containing protein n=1 Tax=Kitasatospora sp. NPDC028055 TaxID=3155653 RepID=UPI0033FD9879
MISTKTMTRAQVDSAERTLSFGTWFITAGAILYSVLTVTPLVKSVSPDGWGWTAPVLPLVVDSAVVIVIRLDSTVARLGGDAGAWPAILRWLTGLFTLLLNVGFSWLNGDWVGVGVHAVAPALLIATGEAGLAYRRAITRALDRLEREHQQQLAREQADRLAREQRAREERDQQRADDERREREAREHQERLDRERADREASERQAERDHQAKLEADRLAHEAAERQADRDAQRQREAQERADRLAREQRDRDEQEARERADQAAREQREADDRRRKEERDRAARERAEQAAREQGEAQERADRERARPAVKVSAVNTVNTTEAAKMTEEKALAFIAKNPGLSVREIADATGWSIGWVSTNRKQLAAAA